MPQNEVSDEHYIYFKKGYLHKTDQNKLFTENLIMFLRLFHLQMIDYYNRESFIDLSILIKEIEQFKKHAFT